MPPADGDGETPRHLTSAGTEFEADIILERLSEAGIQAVQQGPLAPRGGYPSARDIYVDERDLERAHAALKAAEGFSEEELAELSEHPIQTDEGVHDD